MKAKTKIIAFTVVALLVMGGFAVKAIIDYHDVGTVMYEGRTYRKSAIDTDEQVLERVKETVDTGVTAKGMEVYDVKDDPNTPTVLYLKTKEGSFFVYELVGGP